MPELTVEHIKIIAKDDPKDLIELEVGDSKDPDFKPQVKISRWQNEVNLSMRLVHEETAPTKKQDGNIISWEGKKVATKVYPIEDGNRFEIILKEKPKTNVVEFTLQTKGLDFFYQPELTQEEKDEGAERPENVIGSYAVYASEQKTNYAGGKEYKVGKVGHLFRPKATDATNDWVWVDLNIVKNPDGTGIMTKTIPQSFLDKATYPVRIN